MSPMTPEEYAALWTRLAGRDFDDVYIPIHLEDDQAMNQFSAAMPPTFETWRENNRKVLALESRDYAWFDESDCDPEDTLTDSRLTMGMTWALVVLGYLIVGLVLVMVLK